MHYVIVNDSMHKTSRQTSALQNEIGALSLKHFNTSIYINESTSICLKTSSIKAARVQSAPVQAHYLIVKI